MQQNMRFQESFAKGVSEISGQHEEGGKILVSLVREQMDCKMMEVEARINQILTEHRVEYQGREQHYAKQISELTRRLEQQSAAQEARFLALEAAHRELKHGLEGQVQQVAR